MALRTPPIVPAPRVQTVRASTDIIAALREDIASGRLPHGSRLPTETDLAAHYGVSKPTIREAIRSLDSMGLIEVRHGSGAYIRADATFLVHIALQVTMQLQRIGILDALDVREGLGLQSARWAASQRSEEDLAVLEDAYATLSRMDVEDLDELMDAIAAFQEAVSAASHNRLLSVLEGVLIRTLLQMQFKALRQRGLAFWKARAESFQPDRRAILDAIIAADPLAAEAASGAYLAHQRETFVADPDLARLVLSDPAAFRVADELTSAFRQRGAI